MSLPDDVERLALLGWRLFPRAPRSRAAAFKGAHDAATHDLDTLAAWAREYPGCGWQAVCGPSGIWALDVDQKPDANGAASMRELTTRHGALPPAPTVRTGGGGWLVVFQAHTGPLIGQPGWRPGIDPRRGRHSITVPPTIHHRTGTAYRWITPPWVTAPPIAPAWLTSILSPPAEPERELRDPASLSDAHLQRAVDRAFDRLVSAAPGTRNATLNRCAYRLGILVGARFAEQQAEQTLMAGAQRIGLTHAEAAATIRSGLQAGMRART